MKTAEAKKMVEEMVGGASYSLNIEIFHFDHSGETKIRYYIWTSRRSPNEPNGFQAQGGSWEEALSNLRARLCEEPAAAKESETCADMDSVGNAPPGQNGPLDAAIKEVREVREEDERLGGPPWERGENVE